MESQDRLERFGQLDDAAGRGAGGATERRALQLTDAAPQVRAGRV